MVLKKSQDWGHGVGRKTCKIIQLQQSAVSIITRLAGVVMDDLTPTTPMSETEYDWLRCSPRGKDEGKTQSETSISQLQATKVETRFFL